MAGGGSGEEETAAVRCGGDGGRKFGGRCGLRRIYWGLRPGDGGRRREGEEEGGKQQVHLCVCVFCSVSEFFWLRA